MKPSWIRRIILAAALAIFTGAALLPAQAQMQAMQNTSPELVGMLTKDLSITPHQAAGGAGALFGLAKSRLSAPDFSKVSAAVPGMGGLLKAAPPVSSGPLGSLGSLMPGAGGGLAPVFGSFKSLGLSPEMAGKMAPMLTKYVESKGGASLGSLLAGALSPAQAQKAPATTAAQVPSPELVGMLTKDLSITPHQATGGAGALFGLAKSRLSAPDFSKVASAVPGMDGLLKAAPALSGSSSSLGGLGSLASALPGEAGGLASVFGAFNSLGLSPEMATKMAPLLTKYVESRAGASVGSLLGGVLK